MGFSYRIIIALGSNIPDRLNHLQSGLDMFRDIEGIKIVSWSHVYESEPVGEGLEGKFLNAIIVLDTVLSPGKLLQICHQIENKSGRDRELEKNSKNRNRTLDCDVIFYGDNIIQGAELTIPHPRWLERPFVVLPLMDLIDSLTPFQADLVQEAIISPEIDKTSCHRIENMLD